MLEISSFFDAHFHFLKCFPYENPGKELETLGNYWGCTCAHSVEEWYDQKRALESLASDNIHILKAFGMHPQKPLVENAEILEELLKNNELDAIGEAGIDLYADEYKAMLEAQKEAWHIQVELAEKYQKPLIIHCRKGMQHVFEEINSLARIPSILFHSFSGSMEEAHAVLYRLPEAYFSFGKQLMNGNKKVHACMTELPLKNIILETDAPYQRLKDEAYTSCKEIRRVYEEAFKVREDLTEDILKENFFSLYKISR